MVLLMQSERPSTAVALPLLPPGSSVGCQSTVTTLPSLTHAGLDDGNGAFLTEPPTASARRPSALPPRPDGARSVASARGPRSERLASLRPATTQSRRPTQPAEPTEPTEPTKPTDSTAQEGSESLWGVRAKRALRRYRAMGMLQALNQTAGGRVKLKEIEALSAAELTKYLQKSHSPAQGLAAVRPPSLLKPMSALTPRGAKQRAATKARAVEAETQALRDARDYTALAFEAENRLGLRADGKLLLSARAFDELYRARVGATQKHLAMLRFDPERLPSTYGFDVGVGEVFRTRFTTDDTPDSVVAIAARRPRRVHRYHKPWTLEDSQWAPRRDAGNSLDFFETSAAMQQMLCTDWKMACCHHMLAFNICQAQLPLEELQARGINAEQATHEPCVEAVHEVLRRHALVLYNAFDHYALLDKRPTGDVLHTAEIFYVRMQQFFAFVLECQLEDRANLPISMIETIFAIVDAPDITTLARDVHNVRQGLNRHEWYRREDSKPSLVRLQVLVRLAMRKYGRITAKHIVQCSSVAVAVERLISDYLLPLLPRECLVNHNEFRTHFCYRESVDAIIISERPTLRALFEVYAAAAGQGKSNEEALLDVKRLSLGEWLVLLQHVGLFEMGLITYRVAMQAFCRSRIRSSVEWSHAQEIRVRQLSFEDFLEALLRLASVCALPTLEEIEAAGAADAGEFVLALYRDAPDGFRQFAACRTGSWARPPYQRIHKCLTHLLALLRRVIQANFSDNPERLLPKGPIAKGTVEHFFRHRNSRGHAGAIGAGRLALPHLNISAAVVRETMQRVEEHIFLALRSVLAFACLSDADLRTLQANLGVAKFVDGEYVFEQGQEGDVFYLITSGEAEVLHYDPSDALKEETLLNVIGFADCFGETALIERAPRNASVMAKGDLHVAYIARARFESALGRSLAEMRLAHTDKEALKSEMAAAREGADVGGMGSSTE